MKTALFCLMLVLCCREAMAENWCAVTFDDGPGPYTERLLTELDRLDIPATFFVLGENAVKRRKTVRRIIERGHELGSHTWTHVNLKKENLEKARNEMLKTAILIEFLGGECRLVRPPYGEISDEIRKEALRYNLVPVLWDVDSLDWKMKGRDYSKLPDKNDQPFKPGAMNGIFLFHDIQKHTVDDIELILSGLVSGGCEVFATVSDYLEHQKAGR